MFFDFSLSTKEMVSGLVQVVQWSWQFILSWWWVFLPIILFKFWKPLYLWFVNEKFSLKAKYAFLEIGLPREITRPVQAMEQVFSNLWSVYDPANFKEKWLEGKFLLNFSLEIVGIDGQVHFFMRVPAALKEVVQSIIYSQYPNVEIREVDDYTQQVPQKIPNRNWDSWGCDYVLLKEDSYPIKTYMQFFERTPDVKEEKRIDPLAALLEGMVLLKPGEQLWLQLVAKPITNKENDWISRGKALRDKLIHRPQSVAPQSIFKQIIEILFLWRDPDTTPPVKEVPAPMMMLTDEEKASIQAIERKIGKYGFECNVRFIYLGERKSFFKPRIKIPINFFTGLSTEGLNGLRPWNVTKVYYPPAIAQRTYIKKRDLFWHYIHRFPPLFPKPGKTFVLNTEELATLYHFPGKIVVPAASVERVRAKKAEPPINLPIG